MHHCFPTLINGEAPLCAIQRLKPYAINCFQSLLSVSTCGGTHWYLFFDHLFDAVLIAGRGLHSFTFQLNLKRCVWDRGCIHGVFRGCVGGV